MLVDHIVEKIKNFVPVLPKDQKAIKFILERNQNSQLHDKSALMEDLYKILPLTVDTVFDSADSSVVCIFDTA